MFKKFKKFLLLSFMVLFSMGIAFGQLDCSEEGDSRTETFTSMLVNISQYVTIGGDDIKFGALQSVIPTTTFNIDKIENYTTIDNSTTITLIWANISDLVIRNATQYDNIMFIGNYTFDNATGIVTWNLTDVMGGIESWNNTNVSFYYTVNMSGRDMTDTNFLKIDGNISWGQNTGWTVTEADLTNQDWTVGYTYTERTCSARDSCRSTKVIIFAAFGLIVLIIIVGAGFLLTQVIGGDVDATVIGAFAMGAIGLAIVVMIGYVIISRVGVSVCG